MTNWNHPLGGITESVGAATGTSLGTQPATTYTQMVASTTYEWQGFIIDYVTPNSAAKATLDIALGAAAAEFAIAPNILVPALGTTGLGSHSSMYMPLRVPQGSRVAAKSTTAQGHMTIHGLQAAAPYASACGQFLETAGTATSGTAVDPGGTANTKGAWTQLSASTTYDWHGIAISLASSSSTSAGVNYLFDIGVGAAGSEFAIVSNIHAKKSSSAGFSPGFIGFFNGFIPAGSRISVRCQCDVTSATTRQAAANVHGLVL